MVNSTFLIFQSSNVCIQRITSLAHYFSVSFIFGLIIAVSGVAGLFFGSGLSYWLRPKYRMIDPLICGGGLIPSFILTVISLVLAYDNTWATYILLFFGHIFMCMQYAVLSNMTLVQIVFF